LIYPNIAVIFLPAIMGLMSPLPILVEIISDPASPNPSIKRVPIFIIAFSIATISS
jgi:hypothetical protein